MQPPEFPTATSADVEPDTRLDTAIVMLARTHSMVQNLLANVLGSPRDQKDALIVKRLGELREEIWDTMKRVAGDDPRFIKIGRADT